MDKLPWDKLFWIGLGGAIGAISRWSLGGWAQQTAQSAWSASLPATLPLGTLLVNVLGCLLIGGAAGWLDTPPAAREELRLFLIVGVLGGFTTFSAFAWESLALLQQGRGLHAALYILGTNALCLGSAWAGFAAVRAGLRA